MKDEFEDESGRFVTIGDKKVRVSKGNVLDLRKSHLKNLKEVKGIDYLSDIFLIINVNNLETLEGFDNIDITALQFDGYIKKLSNLEGEIKNLEYLGLYFRAEDEISQINFIKKVKTFELQFDGLRRIDNIIRSKFFQNLEIFMISNNSIDILPDLEHAKNLNAINANDCGLKEIGKIPNSIKTLFLSNNELKRVPCLRNKINLEKLWLDNNNITGDLSIDGCNSLKILDLSNNKIKSIIGISDCIKLEEIYIQNNRITLLSIPWNKHLRIINASNNSIEKIKLGVTGEFSEVNFSRNKIKIIEFDDSAGWACFGTLDISHNELEDQSRFEPNFPDRAETIRWGDNPLDFEPMFKAWHS
ncbi:MAG: leucine-rich repeat domain-containing protein [Promethearchaeota archaeon]